MEKIIFLSLRERDKRIEEEREILEWNTERKNTVKKKALLWLSSDLVVGAYPGGSSPVPTGLLSAFRCYEEDELGSQPSFRLQNQGEKFTLTAAFFAFRREAVKRRRVEERTAQTPRFGRICWGSQTRVVATHRVHKGCSGCAAERGRFRHVEGHRRLRKNGGNLPQNCLRVCLLARSVS